MHEFTTKEYPLQILERFILCKLLQRFALHNKYNRVHGKRFTFLGKHNDDKATNGIIIGIEISGDPKYDARKFLPLLRKAKDDLPVIAFHLAEVICA